MVEFEWGRALFNATFDRVWELNVLRVERSGATVRALAAEADRLQGAAGLEHRRALVLDEQDAAAFEPGFRKIGWKADRFVFMVARDAPRDAGDTSGVHEVERSALQPLRETIIREQPWGQDDEVVRQLVASSACVAAAGGARHFGLVVDGTVVAGADLYSDGTTAQIEDVATLPAYRGRGYASAVVTRAREEAAEAGHAVTFLTADENDWPKSLYERLGFESAGRKFAFLKPPARAATA